MISRIAALLASPRVPLACALIAVLWSLPSLRSGLQTDDHLLMRQLDRGVPALEAFRVTREDFRTAQQKGAFSWWSGPDLQVAFLRPLAMLSHRLDHALWGDDALFMHVENVLLYGLMVWLAGLIFRVLLPAHVAGLAALVFALDDGHANSVGWISGRNTLLSALFGFAAVLTHLRSSRRRTARMLSPLCLVLALASGEGGVGALAYLAAYALLLASGPPSERLRALLPHAVVTLAWAGIYLLGDYGAHGAGWYRDFGAAPIDTLLAGVADLPAWLFSLLGVSLVSLLLTVLDPIAPALQLLLVIPLLWLLWPVLRDSRPARFFALSALLAIVPLFNTVAQDRVLIGASLGGAGVIACALGSLAGCRSRLRRISLRTLAVLHLGLSPLLFLPGLVAFRSMEGASQALAQALPNEAGRDVILIDSPLELLPLYTFAIRERSGGAAPASLHQLYAGQSSLTITRSDDRTLEVTATPRFCHRPVERIFTAPDWSARVGETRRFGPMNVQVVEADAADLPVRVRFRFDAPLESDRYAWRVWQGTGVATWVPPPVGARVELEALSLTRSMPH